MENCVHVDPGCHAEVVFRGDRDKLKFIVFWLKDHRVLAGMNVCGQTDAIKAPVRSSRPVETARLADTSDPLAAILAGSTAAGGRATPAPCAGGQVRILHRPNR